MRLPSITTAVNNVTQSSHRTTGCRVLAPSAMANKAASKDAYPCAVVKPLNLNWESPQLGRRVVRKTPIANTPMVAGTRTKEGVKNPALVARIKAMQIRNEPNISTVSLAADSGNNDQKPANPA